MSIDKLIDELFPTTVKFHQSRILMLGTTLSRDEMKVVISRHFDEVKAEAIAETIISENKKQMQQQKFSK